MGVGTLLDTVLGRRPKLQDSVGQSQPWDEHIPGVTMDPGMPGAASVESVSTPMARSRMPVSPDPSLVPSGPDPAPNRLDTLQNEYDAASKGPTMKSRLLHILGGAIAGGAGGAVSPQAGEMANRELAGHYDEQSRERNANRRSLQTQITEEQRYQGTLAHQTSQDAETKRLRDAQIGNINDEIANRGNQAPARQEIEGPEGNGVIQQWDPATHSWKEMGKAFHPDKVPPADEIERLWGNDPAHAGKKMSLQDRIDYENQLAKGKHQPPDPSYTPTVDAAGNITGRWNNRTGMAEPTTPKPIAAGTPPPPPQRKTGLSSAIANREIQADAVTMMRDNLVKEISDPHIMEHLGPAAGRIQNIEQFLGDPDPQVAGLRAKMDSYFAMQPALAGMRSSERVKYLEDNYGRLKFTPESLTAMIKGVGEHASAVQGAIKNFTTPQSQQAPAPPGAESEVYIKGKLAGHVVKGAYVPLAGGQNAATKK